MASDGAILLLAVRACQLTTTDGTYLGELPTARSRRAGPATGLIREGEGDAYT